MLSDQQERSIAQSNGQINVWDGAIRAGKTVASLLRWGQYVASWRGGGALVVSGRTVDTIARNVFRPLCDPALMGPAARLSRYTRGAATGTVMGREVEVISGYDIRSEERLRGLTAGGAYVDEASVLPAEFVDQLVGRCSVPGAQLFMTTNPGAPQHWFKLRYIDQAWRSTGVDIRHWKFTLDDNPSLTPEYRTMIKALYTGVWYKRMIMGLWVMAEGAIFDSYDPDRHVVDILPTIVEWLSVGIDYGTTAPFAALLLGIGADGCLYLAGEYRHDSKAAGRQLTDRQYSEALRTWLADFRPAYRDGPGPKGVRPRYTFVDPSAASMRTQLHRDRWVSWPGDNSVSDGLRTMASLFAAGKIKIHRSCRGLIGELPGYVWDSKQAEKGHDEPVKRDDHSIDAARYATRSSEALWYRRVYGSELPAAAA